MLAGVSVWNPFAHQPERTGRLEPQRVHVDQPAAADVFGRHILHYLRQLYKPSRKLSVICIGTDRSTGDCLGPLVGTKLTRELPADVIVLGTLMQPVHAVNLQEAVSSLRAQASDPFIIAIDACLGRSENIGYISLKEGPLQPGTGVNKTLPTVGDIHVIGIVNVGGFMEYLVLQNTRLSLVVQMAEIIADGLREAIQRFMGTQSGIGPDPNLARTEAAAVRPGIF